MSQVAEDFPRLRLPSGLPVQCLKNYSTGYGFDPEHHVDKKKMLTLDQARAMHAGGAYYAILFGPPEDPVYYIEVFEGDERVYRRIDVYLIPGNVKKIEYTMAVDTRPGKSGPDLFLREYRDFDCPDAPNGWYHIFFADAFVDGDFPTLILDGKRMLDRALSVPLDNLWLGPFPTFDELLDGAFVARLPVVTYPPEEVRTDYIPQILRTSTTPKRAPTGRFPW